MLNILSGYETAHIRSLPIKPGELIEDGNWVVYDGTTGLLIKQTGNYSGVAGDIYLVFGGNDVRFDSKEMSVVSVVTSRSIVGETDKVAAVTIHAGDPLTVVGGVLTNVLSLGATPTNNTLDVVGYALTDNTSGTLQFRTK